jgi:hypothetical protein
VSVVCAPWKSVRELVYVDVRHLNIYKVLMNNLGLFPDVHFLGFVYHKEYKVRKINLWN